MADKSPPVVKKAPPVIPIPKEMVKQGAAFAKQNPWLKKNAGEFQSGHVYRDAQGRALYFICRYWNKTKKSKEHRPIHYTGDGKFALGQPYASARPLYNLHKLSNTDLPVLLVEGEKCADVKVNGYVLVTWAGGALAIHKTDWSPLAGKSIVVWPDNDEPGKACAYKIKKLLEAQSCKVDVLQIPAGKPIGWDIADAAISNVKPEQFLEDYFREEATQKESKLNAAMLPIIALGYQANHHFFLKKSNRSVVSIGFGSWNSSKVLELASLAFWEDKMGLVNRQGNPDVTRIQDMLSRASEGAGLFDESKLISSGALSCDGEIFLNTSKQVMKHGGESFAIEDSDRMVKDKYFMQGRRFSTLAERGCDVDVGKQLLELAKAQEFESDFSPIALLGWCVVAPFCGALEWRPHIWVTGKSGSGKSWVIGEYISRLLGEFKHASSAKDTEAGLRESIKSMAMPVIIDEMDANLKTRDSEKVQSIMTLARNASNDSSSRIHMSMSGGGVKIYIIKSMFCFSSIALPVMDSAVSSRITFLEIDSSSVIDRKQERSIPYMDALSKASALRRRTYHRLADILFMIKQIKQVCDVHHIGRRREIDQIAPLLAGMFAATKDALPSEDEIIEILQLYIKGKDISMKNEDSYMHEILCHVADCGGGERRTIASLIKEVSKQIVVDENERGNSPSEVLARYGIFAEPNFLYIANNSPEIRKIFTLKGMPDNYAKILKRHYSLLRDKKTIRKWIGGVQHHCSVYHVREALVNNEEHKS